MLRFASQIATKTKKNSKKPKNYHKPATKTFKPFTNYVKVSKMFKI